MKSNIYIILGVFVLVAVGMYGFSRSSVTITPTDYKTPVTAQNETVPPADSRYVVYSQTAFEAAADKKRVLFFHAPWCPTCRPADAAFQKDAALIPTGVVLFKTDYDTSDVLKKKYKVTYQHTFVLVDASGNEVTKWNGGRLDELIANIK